MSAMALHFDPPSYLKLSCGTGCDADSINPGGL